MTKLRIGDVIEIKTKKGFAYAQYTQNNKRYGELLRVYGKIYIDKKHIFEFIHSESPAFICFFPLREAIKQQIVSIVANEIVPAAAKEFPTFRAGVVDPQTKKVGVWWLWDGENEWKVNVLSREQRSFPIRGIWNDTLLIERIDSGWTADAEDV